MYIVPKNSLNQCIGREMSSEEKLLTARKGGDNVLFSVYYTSSYSFLIRCLTTLGLLLNVHWLVY